MPFDFGRQQAVWSGICHRIEGRWVPRDGGPLPAIQVYRREWLLTLDLLDAEGEPPVVRLRAPFASPTAFRFSIARPSGWHKALELFRGEADPVPLPSHLFQVQCDEPEKLTALLSRRELAQRIADQQPLILTVRDGASYPAGVDLLLMHVAGPLDATEPILEAYELFADLTEALDALHGLEEDLEERLLRRLDGPSGRVREDGLELWDGDSLRAHSASLLGARRCERALPSLVRLSRENRAATRLAAVRALRRIDSPEAIPALIPLLTDERTCGSAKISEEAAVSLRKLGAGNWVDWFERVVGGSMDGTRLAGPYREPAIQALLQVARAADPQQTVYACLALADLGAPGTLQAVRHAIGRHGRHLVGPVLEPLLEKLESGADLPRPAQAPLPEGSTLPVPSEPAGEGAQDLLRSADAPWE